MQLLLSPPRLLLETPDEKVTIVCGDSHLNKISNEVWKDRKRPGEGLKMNPPPADGKRPCSATDAVVYSAQGGKVMMLCDERPSALLNPTRSMPTISWARKYLELKNKEFDRFNVHLSSGLTHELIHLGDGKRCEYTSRVFLSLKLLTLFLLFPVTRVLTEPGKIRDWRSIITTEPKSSGVSILSGKTATLLPCWPEVHYSFLLLLLLFTSELIAYSPLVELLSLY